MKAPILGDAVHYHLKSTRGPLVSCLAFVTNVNEHHQGNVDLAVLPNVGDLPEGETIVRRTSVLPSLDGTAAEGKWTWPIAAEAGVITPAPVAPTSPVAPAAPELPPAPAAETPAPAPAS